MIAAKQMLVKGMVQGVGFRWTCKRIADHLGLSGWARNNPDGTVSVVVEGPDTDLDQFTLELDSQMGQYITEITIRDQKPDKKRDRFEIIH